MLEIPAGQSYVTGRPGFMADPEQSSGGKAKHHIPQLASTSLLNCVSPTLHYFLQFSTISPTFLHLHFVSCRFLPPCMKSSIACGSASPISKRPSKTRSPGRPIQQSAGLAPLGGKPIDNRNHGRTGKFGRTYRHAGHANSAVHIGGKVLPETARVPVGQGHKGRQGRGKGQAMVQGCRSRLQDSP